MRFHVALPGCMNVPAITQPWEPALTGGDVLAVAREVDRLGFDGVFVPEHFLTATGHVELTGNHYFDASTAQAAIASTTPTSGARMNTPLLALAGMIGSFRMNLRKSANGCIVPHGPTTLGPRRR